jgi:ATP-dependent DNA helicase RecG
MKEHQQVAAAGGLPVICRSAGEVRQRRLDQDRLLRRQSRSGYIEAWGRGIEKIEHECRTHGIKPPEYEIDANGIMVIFHANPAHIEAAGKSFPAYQKTQEASETRLGEKLGETRVAVVAFMRQDSKVTTTQLAEKLGISATAIDKNIQYLKSHGHIRRVGPAKGGHWEVLK